MKNILYFFMLITATGCGTTKVVKEKREEQKEVIVNTDRITTIERNKAIIDSLKFKIAQSQTGDQKFDSAVNSAVSKILSNLNSSKSSGDNSYQLKYDDVLKELRALIKVGPTDNQTTINNATVHTKEIIKDTREIPVKYMPKWVVMLSCFGGCCVIAATGFLIYRVSRWMRPKLA
ncbi:hypothetical protein [Flavobacterium kingsejongi]|uniref:Uncharacterized protein n=1 Tax=Flavobacterium kingsejongi TaxID=1678728 RepID=A0A2S1LTW6_9FLAO|nr:hypothetical protein [Flavobacterium kingsejongi]AWG27197.1 hypothetical protein FK004_19230 [Flavobacterium kingsejongi]